MREAKEVDEVRQFIRRVGRKDEPPFRFGDGSEIDLAASCVILGGRNGAGKSRALRAIADQLGDRAVHVDLQWLCSKTLDLLETRGDIDAMAEEFEAVELTGERLDDVSRIVGRTYETVDWFALEIEPGEHSLSDQFVWSDDQPLVPHFRVGYRGRTYGTKEMGLGEFSVHFLFWIIEQLREAKDITLLLDEPDAFLPPIGVSAMLGRLAAVCKKRRWSLIITTHSEELIRTGVEFDCFTFLDVDAAGDTIAVHSVDEPSVAEPLLSRPAVDSVFLCEDEVASHFVRSMLDAHDPALSARTTILWGGGTGMLEAVSANLPKPPRAGLSFVFIYDGGIREADVAESPWPVVFLPTDQAPDELLMQFRDDVDVLGSALGLTPEHAQRLINSLEGTDPHDWVNGVGEAVGRQAALQAMAMSWVRGHAEQSQAFISKVTAAL